MTVITGAPRSGTTYLSRVLRLYGLRVGHETWDKDTQVIIDWHEVCRCRSGVNYIHLVRNPLDCIASMQTISNASRGYFAQHIPSAQQYEPHSLPFLVECWLQWTSAADQLASYGHEIVRYCVEDLNANNPHTNYLLTEIDNRFDKASLQPFNEVSQLTNSRKHTQVTLEDIKKKCPTQYDDLISHAAEYGYKLSE